eukprot:TRINITY_DN90769_c0_g1_i1.p1 TRINITY_DN90769_c0_g1~~TRINITY_DN90769_c0_g1_i1.p1  ORF type:complete len:1361 (-),score=356.81 TRINITY_DN90769_c0_g1_i1:263-4345(-)
MVKGPIGVVQPLHPPEETAKLLAVWAAAGDEATGGFDLKYKQSPRGGQRPAVAEANGALDAVMEDETRTATALAAEVDKAPSADTAVGLEKLRKLLQEDSEERGGEAELVQQEDDDVSLAAVRPGGEESDADAADEAGLAGLAAFAEEAKPLPQQQQQQVRAVNLEAKLQAAAGKLGEDTALSEGLGLGGVDELTSFVSYLCGELRAEHQRKVSHLHRQVAQLQQRLRDNDLDDAILESELPKLDVAAFFQKAGYYDAERRPSVHLPPGPIRRDSITEEIAPPLLEPPVIHSPKSDCEEGMPLTPVQSGSQRPARPSTFSESSANSIELERASNASSQKSRSSLRSVTGRLMQRMSVLGIMDSGRTAVLQGISAAQQEKGNEKTMGGQTSASRLSMQSEDGIGKMESMFGGNAKRGEPKEEEKEAEKLSARSEGDYWPPKIRQLLHHAAESPHKHNKGGRPTCGLLSATSFVRTRSQTRASLQSVQTASAAYKKPRLPLHPDSSFRMLCDFIFVIVLTYDGFAEPYKLAFNVGMTGWQRLQAELTLAFFMVDIVLSFMTGYTTAAGEQVEMGWKNIWDRYLKSWFVLDVVVVAIDWISLLNLVGTDKETGMVKFLRCLRIARLLRVVRVAKGRQSRVVSKVQSFVDTSGMSDMVAIAVRVAKSLIFITWINHIGCCLWYWIGREAQQNGVASSWLDELSEQNAYMYANGYIWSTTTIIGGESPMTGENAFELLFQVSWLMTGLVVGTSLISTIAAMMTELQMKKQELTDKMSSLRRFLREQNVDFHLALAVQHQARLRMSSRRRLSSTDVPALQMISAALRIELRCAICERFFLMHPLIRTFNEIDRGVTKNALASGVVELNFLNPGDCIFESKKTAQFAYFLSRGQLTYLHDKDWLAEAASTFGGLNTSRSSLVSRHTTMPVQKARTQKRLKHGGSSELAREEQRRLSERITERNWVSEKALWMNWTHTGWLESLDAAEVLTIRAEEFCKQMTRNALIAVVAVDYAKAFARHLAASRPHRHTDLDGTLEEHGLIVLCVETETRYMMSMPLLEHLRYQQTLGVLGILRGNKLAELENEVESGACTLVFDASGRVRRTVSVVVICLQREDGRILAQMGKMSFRDGSLSQARCQLPGTKAKSSEFPSDAFQRFANEALGPLMSDVCVENQEVERDEQASASYNGLRTSYNRTKFHARLDGGQSKKCHASAEVHLARHAFLHSKRLQMDAGSRLRAILPESWSPKKRGSRAALMQDDIQVFTFTPTAHVQPDSVTLFAWLTQERYHYLSTEREGRQWLEEYLHTFTLTDDERLRYVPVCSPSHEIEVVHETTSEADCTLTPRADDEIYTPRPLGMVPETLSVT